VAKRVIKVKIEEEYGNAMKRLIAEGKCRSQAEFINKALRGHLLRYYPDRIRGNCSKKLRSIENSKKGEKDESKTTRRKL